MDYWNPKMTITVTTEIMAEPGTMAVVNKMMMIKKQLSSQKGESLIESLISIVIFSLLIVTITLTIATALRITTQTTADALAAQDIVNEIVRGEYATVAVPETDEVMFTLTFEVYDREEDERIPMDDEATTIEASHPVYTNNEPGRLAFMPVPEDPEEPEDPTT